jgi:pSer/pThr/pTyr-binding forkhead associated (FHA) protein
VTLGRRHGNGIVLQGDAYVSGLHGQLLYKNEQFSYIDLGSTNGSLLNNQRLAPDQPALLSDGDLLTLGRTELVFKMGDPFKLHSDDSSEPSE